jgi:hypothetical protein
MVLGGPLIPVELLEAHEEGRLLFFCGAGVAAEAGLPCWSELVKTLAEEFEDVYSSAATDGASFEERLGTLEREHRRRCGGREPCDCVRGKIADELTRRAKGDLPMHKALLQLSCVPIHAPFASISLDGVLKGLRYRIVTTNFDLCFQKAADELKFQSVCAAAPLLPVPKVQTLHGVIHLHGRVGGTPGAPNQGLENLVLTSGDYGRAYITERWAGRFITELVRNFTVCFIGYSFGDTVMRYLRDAVAAEQGARGRYRPPYIFVPKSEAYRHHESGIAVIPYAKAGRHAALRRTVQQWSRQYQGARYSRLAEVQKLSSAAALQPLPEDRDRLLWAVWGKDAEVVHHLATHRDGEELLPVDWVWQLGRKLEESQPFFAARLPLSDQCPKEHYHHLATWFARQAGCSQAIAWFCTARGEIDSRLGAAIRLQLDEASDWSTAAVVFWRLALSGRSERSAATSASLPEMSSRAGAIGLWELKLRLAPRLTRSGFIQSPPAVSEKIDNLRDWTVVLADDALAARLWDELLRPAPASVPMRLEFTTALADMLLTQIDESLELWGHTENDFKSLWLAELEATPTLRDERTEWLVLPILLDRLLRQIGPDPDVAKRWVEGALATRHAWVHAWLLFRAARDDRLATPGLFVDRLIANESRWLWSPLISRTVESLLEVRSADLTELQRERLIEASLEVGKEASQRGSEYTEGLRYRRLRALCLPPRAFSPAVTLAKEWLLQIESEHPEWKDWPRAIGLPSEQTLHHRDWERPVVRFASSGETSDWLAKRADGLEESDIIEVCRGNISIVALALSELEPAASQISSHVLRAVLWALSSSPLTKPQTEGLVRLLTQVPSATLGDVARPAAFVLSRAVADGDCETSLLVGAIARVLAVARDDGEAESDSVTFAINQAAGVTLEARFRLWLRQTPGEVLELQEDLKELVEGALSRKDQRSAAVVLGRFVNHCYVADASWARRALLPAMRWNSDRDRAAALWVGYIRGGRLYPRVLEELASEFKTTFKRVRSDREAARLFASMSTLAAADDVGGLSDSDWGEVFAAFDDDALVASAFQLMRMVEAAGDRALGLWHKGGAAYRVLRLWPNRVFQDEGKARQVASALMCAILVDPNAVAHAEPFAKPWLRELAPHQLRLSDELCAWVRAHSGQQSPMISLVALFERCIAVPKAKWPKNFYAIVDALSSSGSAFAQDLRVRRWRGEL